MIVLRKIGQQTRCPFDVVTTGEMHPRRIGKVSGRIRRLYPFILGHHPSLSARDEAIGLGPLNTALLTSGQSQQIYSLLTQANVPSLFTQACSPKLVCLSKLVHPSEAGCR